jgi:hypothetical protein
LAIGVRTQFPPTPPNFVGRVGSSCPYADKIILFDSTPEVHIRCLIGVLDRRATVERLT